LPRRCMPVLSGCSKSTGNFGLSSPASRRNRDPGGISDVVKRFEPDSENPHGEIVPNWADGGGRASPRTGLPGDGCRTRHNFSGIRLGRSFRTFAHDRRGWLSEHLITCIDPPSWGHVAEWLRSGLQNRLHQFNSGRGLQSIPLGCFMKNHSRSVLDGNSATALLPFLF
jgi:hypothetical protein